MSETTLSTRQALSLLDSEVRLAILQAVAAAESPLSFSELRTRTGVRDSGGFNYHLGKLTGVYVRQTQPGYVLTPAGEAALAAVERLPGGGVRCEDGSPTTG